MELKCVDNPKPNKKQRLLEFDYLKFLLIIIMIANHVCEYFQFYIGYMDSKFADIVFWMCSLGTAVSFMFCMGAGMVFTRNKDPKSLINRGIWLFVVGYLLNFVRGTLFVLVFDLGKADFLDNLLDETLTVDIFIFAGLAFILTGFLRKKNLSIYKIFIISLFMLLVGNTFMAADIDYKQLGIFSYFTDLILPLTGKDHEAFSLTTWYWYVICGAFFAEFLLNSKSKDRFYKGVFIFSVIFSLLGIVTFKIFNIDTFFTLSEMYYQPTLIHFPITIGTCLIFLSFFYFFRKKINNFDRFMMFVGTSLPKIYLTHWIVIKWLVLSTVIVFIYPTFGMNDPLAFVIVVISILLSFGLVYLYNRLKVKNKK